MCHELLHAHGPRLMCMDLCAGPRTPVAAHGSLWLLRGSLWHARVPVRGSHSACMLPLPFMPVRGSHRHRPVCFGNVAVHGRDVMSRGATMPRGSRWPVPVACASVWMPVRGCLWHVHGSLWPLRGCKRVRGSARVCVDACGMRVDLRGCGCMAVACAWMLLHGCGCCVDALACAWMPMPVRGDASSLPALACSRMCVDVAWKPVVCAHKLCVAAHGCLCLCVWIPNVRVCPCDALAC